MPIGDTGGTYSQLIITCYAGENLEKGMPVVLCKDYTVMNSVNGVLFGQILETKLIGETVPVIVRGVLSFKTEKRMDGDFVYIYKGNLTGSNIGIGRILFQNKERVDVLL